MNKVFLMGNLTRDVELKNTPTISSSPTARKKETLATTLAARRCPMKTRRFEE